MNFEAYLSDLDARYDPSLRVVGRVAQTPGYHTRIADGTWVHETRESMDYAIALLQANTPERNARACDVIDRIVELQVTDPTVKHYGIWGWFVEEPPEQMNPADWNWADFIGVRLAQVLSKHASQLRDATRSGARAALGHAGMCVFRRNIGPEYTNIAVMGAVATAAAGELLGMPMLLEYARARLTSVVRLLERTGGFNEYNSPAYTRIVIEETERALLMIKDGGVRELCERLRVAAWETIADHFHPATGQIAGPCSRTYTDLLPHTAAAYFSEQADAPVFFPTQRDKLFVGSTVGDYNVVPGIPCPESLKQRFAKLPTDPYEVAQKYGHNLYGDVIGTTWFSKDACLGSINHDITWVQRRPLLGYWRGGEDSVAVLRGRMLRDGADLACGYVWQAAKGPRVLTSWSLVHGGGDRHPFFDRNDESVFEMSDLRVRYQLAGAGARVEQIGDSTYRLSAGGHCAILSLCDLRLFCGEPARIELANGDDLAGVDVVLYQGPKRALKCMTDTIELVAGVQIAETGIDLPIETPKIVEARDNARTWAWHSLRMTAPVSPSAFTW